MVFKIHPEALIPLRGSYVDVFPLLAFFILSFSAFFFLFHSKRINLLRRGLQSISVFLFVYFTAECFCFIRNTILFGIPLIGKNELLSFGYLVLFIFIVAFAIIFGRIFCGWICPFGFLQEIVFFLNKRIKRNLHLPLLILALLGGIIYLILLKPSQDILIQFIPHFLVLLLLLILLIRTVNFKLEPRLKKIRFIIFLIWIVLLLGRIYIFEPWCYLHGLKTGEYGIVGAFYIIMVGFPLFFRPYCRFICPVGVSFYFCAKHSVFNLKKKEDCKRSCSNCLHVCPIQNIDKGKIKDKSECILCGECIRRDGFRLSLR